MNDRVNSVEHVAELWLRGELIVDKSGLESFLRCDNKESFAGTGCKTAEEVVCLGLLGENVRLCVLICAKTHVVLGHGEHKERTVTLVQGERTASFDRVSNHVDCTHGVLLLVQLHHCLCVFGWVSA